MILNNLLFYAGARSMSAPRPALQEGLVLLIISGMGPEERIGERDHPSCDRAVPAMQQTTGHAYPKGKRRSRRRRFGKSLLPFYALSAMMVALALLGVLEYRWTGTVMEAGIRTRLLCVNFAVLMVLALGLVTILVYALRSQNLLRLQMEFVASVSHELRTPLSVIASAADNLAEGVVRSETTVRDYGALVRSECRRLSALVEQTLRFAAGKADYRPRNFQFLRVPDLVDQTLAEASALLGTSGFTVVKDFHPDLPMARVDVHLLSECLLNLISNAVKYGGSRRWIRIRAVPVETGHGTGVRITVEDHGIGIAPEELPHIFEPFYRGREARSAQIQGTGLGLCLAQEAASSMGARITVESEPGQGSTFAIHLPAAYMNSSTIPVEAIVES